MTNMENMKSPTSDNRGTADFSFAKRSARHSQMRTSTSNRLLPKTLRTLCCVGALTACSGWTAVVTWQMNPDGVLNSSKDSSQSALGSNGSDIDTSRESPSPVSQSAGQSLASSPNESLLFAASNTATRSATELDEAMTRTFDEGFVSVPTVQFASTATATGAQVASGASMTSGPNPLPVPEMSALFPIVGLIAAISCTQILRRRRAAQQSASRIIG